MSFFHSISNQEAQKLIADNFSSDNFSIIDIRTSGEFLSGHLSEAKNIDFYSPDFMKKLDELPKDRKYLIYCRSGSRSKAAIAMMKTLGFQSVYELDKGIDSF